MMSADGISCRIADIFMFLTGINGFNGIINYGEDRQRYMQMASKHTDDLFQSRNWKKKQKTFELIANRCTDVYYSSIISINYCISDYRKKTAYIMEDNLRCIDPRRWEWPTKRPRNYESTISKVPSSKF